MDLFLLGHKWTAPVPKLFCLTSPLITIFDFEYFIKNFWLRDDQLIYPWAFCSTVKQFTLSLLFACFADALQRAKLCQIEWWDKVVSPKIFSNLTTAHHTVRWVQCCLCKYNATKQSNLGTKNPNTICAPKSFVVRMHFSLVAFIVSSPKTIGIC